MYPIASGRYHFQGQRENEKVLKVVHRHWFNLLSHMFVVIVLSGLLLGSFFLVPLLFPELLTPAYQSLLLFIQNTFFIFTWLLGFLVWIDYYFDVWIITNERIVNIEQKGLFVRHVSELRFTRIQDVTTEVTGLLETILDFGDVLVQTAAEEEHFIFRQVGSPFAVKDMVMKLAQSSTESELEKIVTALKK